MKKLKEVDTKGEFGTSLGREVEFDDDHADAILAGQEKPGAPKCWELVPDESTAKKGKADPQTV